MDTPKLRPTESIDDLRRRVDRLLSARSPSKIDTKQLSLFSELQDDSCDTDKIPTSNVKQFLDFASDAMPDGDIYLFGGILRDLLLFGKRGFNSDIDIVVEGDWCNLVPFLEHLNARKNKFGGYRLAVCDWPIDIWNTRETWAIKHGLVPYFGVASLTNTTVLNWDAILMNWRTKQFIYRENYFQEINARALDVVLKENPNPKGMAVRVFRHLCHKDARKITTRAAEYLASSAQRYSFNELHIAERNRHHNPIIEEKVYRFFKHIDTSRNHSMQHRFSIAHDIMLRELDLSDPGIYRTG